jgi:hypothetical protein
MNHDDIQARLRDLSLDDLSLEDARAVAEHLDACPICAREVEWSDDLRAGYGALPKSREPGRDLWSAIEARLSRAQRPRETHVARARARWWMRPAAGVAFAALAASFALWMLAPRKPSTETAGPIETGGGVERTVPPEVAAGDELLLTPTVRALESECTAVGRQILATLPGPPTQLSPATAAAFEQNLASLDRAIGETVSALAEYPRDPELLRRLTAHYHRKLMLLHEAARLASESTA